MTKRLVFPGPGELMGELHRLAETSDPLRRYLAATRTKVFIHPDGRTDPLEDIRITPRQAALLAHLARACPARLSVDVGFGMGSSATIVLAARRAAGHAFEHIALDPFRLPNGRGRVVEDYLEHEFGPQLQVIARRSEVGLAQLVAERGEGQAGLVFIDGCHHFENVMTDFVLADLLCCRGGFLVFDDAEYGAIETVFHYVIANRPDYAVAYLPAPNTFVLQKISDDARSEPAFQPFAVSARSDFTRASRARRLLQRIAVRLQTR